MKILAEKALFFRILGRSPACLIGGACIGGTASIPRIQETLNPECLDLGKEISKKYVNLQQASTSNIEVDPEKYWEGDFTEKGTLISMPRENIKSICYSYLHNDQSFKEWSSQLDELE